jgi:hypothetical protein
MIPSIPKILSIFICVSMMPINCHAKCEIFFKNCSCSINQIKGPDAFPNTLIIFKNDNLALSSPRMQPF